MITNNKTKVFPEINNSENYIWQQEIKPNCSGTTNSYHPKISKNIAKKNSNSNNIKEIWSPE